MMPSSSLHQQDNSNTINENILFQIYKEILDPNIGIIQNNKKYISSNTFIQWLMKRGLAINEVDADMYIQILVNNRILSKSLFFHFNNIYIINKDQIPTTARTATMKENKMISNNNNNGNNKNTIMRLPFQNENGTLVIRKTLWQKHSSNHKARVKIRKEVYRILQKLKKELGKKHITDSAVAMIEMQLYQNAQTFDQYHDLSTLKKRVKDLIDEKNQMKYDPHGKEIEFVHSSHLYEKINMFPNSNKLFILSDNDKNNDGGNHFKHVLLKETHEHYMSEINNKLINYSKEGRSSQETVDLIQKYIDHGMSFDDAKKNALKITRNKFL